MARYLLEISVFVCGGVVMIYEIVGSRILSPYVGVSTYVWTSLIGTILAALSLGYWLGGRIADRRPDARLLGSLIVAAGGLIGLTVLIKDVFLSAIASAAVPLELKAVIAALLLFAPASVCLGMVTPFAARLRLSDVERTGRTIGRLYALSTVGSIAGTFAAGFLLIPFVGSVRTLYGLAAVLLCVGGLLIPLSTKLNIVAVLLVIFGIAASELTAYALLRNSRLHDIDTEYSRVQVFQTTDPSTSRLMTAMATDPYFVQSAMFVDSDDLALEYSRFYHLIRNFKPGFTDTLMIGGAGYSFPKEYLRTYPDARMDVVEIDPGMTAIARKFFRLTEDPRLHIMHQDARMLLRNAEAATYDAVLMDAFGSLFSVPYHLTTVEAVRDISRVLKDDGVVIFNLGSAIQGPASRFLHTELATYRAVFPVVYVFKVNPHYSDERLQNLIIVAVKQTPSAESGSVDPSLAAMIAHRYQPDLSTNEPILTDDLSPVEYYNSIAQNYYLATR